MLRPVACDCVAERGGQHQREQPVDLGVVDEAASCLVSRIGREDVAQ
jgi:hypothetical protein